jgi:hypothetical protein
MGNAASGSATGTSLLITPPKGGPGLPPPQGLLAPASFAPGTGIPMRPLAVKTCGHADCSLWTPQCCSCSDGRPQALDGLYDVYVDGVGYRHGAQRWHGYCPQCRARCSRNRLVPSNSGPPLPLPPPASRQHSAPAVRVAREASLVWEAMPGESDEEFAERLGRALEVPAVLSAAAASHAVMPSAPPAPPGAVAPAAAAETSRDAVTAPAEAAALRDALTCSVCLGLLALPVTTLCGHTFCRECIVGVASSRAASGGTVPCPMCRADLSVDELRRSAPCRTVIDIMALLGGKLQTS